MVVAPIWCPLHSFSKKFLFQKRPKKPTNFEKFKNIFFISGSNFIVLFNGTLFVFIISVVAEAQKETFLPSRFNWPPLYIYMTLQPNVMPLFRFFLCYYITKSSHTYTRKSKDTCQCLSLTFGVFLQKPMKNDPFNTSDVSVINSYMEYILSILSAFT